MPATAPNTSVAFRSSTLKSELPRSLKRAGRPSGDCSVRPAKITAAAQAEAEQLIKDTKQQCHRQWRESVANAEKEAEQKAGEILEIGKKEAQECYENSKDSASEVADWLVREVMTNYGSC